MTEGLFASLGAAVSTCCFVLALTRRTDTTVVARLPMSACPARRTLLRSIIAVLASKAPFLVEAHRVRRRLRRADAELPLLLDALSSAAVAGLPPQSALRRAVAVVHGPLADEVRAALHAVDLGARWHDRLQLLAERLPLRDLTRAIAVMTRTDSVGASFADGMTTLAVRAREARRVELARRARTAPVKMLFPLVFLVLPAFLLLTVVPLLVATLDPIR